MVKFPVKGVKSSISKLLSETLFCSQDIQVRVMFHRSTVGTEQRTRFVDSTLLKRNATDIGVPKLQTNSRVASIVCPSLVNSLFPFLCNSVPTNEHALSQTTKRGIVQLNYLFYFYCLSIGFGEEGGGGIKWARYTTKMVVYIENVNNKVSR